jgi:hypothetical protein
MNPALIQAIILNFALPEFISWLRRRRERGAETVPPDAAGACPTGYDKGVDGLCHLHIPTVEELAEELGLTTNRSIDWMEQWLRDHPEQT